MEVISAGTKRIGRYIVLVSLGLGCTVWYTLEPHSVGNILDSCFFAPMNFDLNLVYLDYKPV